MEQLKTSEIIYLTGLLLLIIFVIIRTFASKNKLDIFSPIIFITIIYLIYTVIGPIILLNFDLKIFPKHYMRQFYNTAWLGSLVSLFFIIVGYYLTFYKKHKNIKIYINKFNKMFLIGLIINITGLTFYILVNPTRFLIQLNPFSEVRYPELKEFGGFFNYLNMMINFLIIGDALLLMSMKKINIFNIKFWVFALFTTITFIIYSALGFRYRILMLFVTMFVAYFLSVKKRPSFLIISIVIPLFIALMGLLSVIRSHTEGLMLSQLKKKQDVNFLIEAFRETNIFPISGAVINAVPSRVKHSYFDNIINSLILPIPRKFIPNKNTEKYIRDPIKTYKPLKRIEAPKWAEVLFFAEWYVSFGWIGIILSSIFLGFIYRRIWEYTLININSRYYIVIYSISLSFLYFFITRGYLPGVLTIFVFTVFPANIAHFFGRLRIYNKKLQV